MTAAGPGNWPDRGEGALTAEQLAYMVDSPDLLTAALAAEVTRWRALRDQRTSLRDMWNRLRDEIRRGRSPIAVYDEIADHIFRLEMEAALARAGQAGPMLIDALALRPGDLGVLIFRDPADIAHALGVGRVLMDELKKTDPETRVIMLSGESVRELRIMTGAVASLELLLVRFGVLAWDTAARLPDDGPDGARGKAHAELDGLFRRFGHADVDHARRYLTDQMRLAETPPSGGG